MYIEIMGLKVSCLNSSLFGTLIQTLKRTPLNNVTLHWFFEFISDMKYVLIFQLFHLLIWKSRNSDDKQKHLQIR